MSFSNGLGELGLGELGLGEMGGHRVRYHQYAGDTQLHLAVRSDKTAAGLNVYSLSVTGLRNWSIITTLTANSPVQQ